jgi:CheY-like chemotaxis protein
VKPIILLADDSPTIQRLVAQTFVDGNFEVISVSNGDAAIRKFEEVRPNLVLADIYMPGKNGYEVCTYVRNHPELGETPVILLLGAFDAFDEATASRAGASSHITKPFEPQALISLVSSLITKCPSAPRSSSARPAEPVEVRTAPEIAAPLQEHGAAAATPPVETKSEPVVSPQPPPTPDPVKAPEPRVAARGPESPEGGDLLGLNELFKPAETPSPVLSVSDAEIDLIVDRVIKKLSTQVIENVAWDVVPHITAKVLKEELKRQS